MTDGISRLVELSGRATQGDWFVGIDDAHDIIAHKDSGLAQIDNGTLEDWPVARLCEHPTAQFIAALVNWFRAEKDRLEILNRSGYFAHQEELKELDNGKVS